jgi:hypothetical protein
MRQVCSSRSSVRGSEWLDIAPSRLFKNKPKPSEDDGARAAERSAGNRAWQSRRRKSGPASRLILPRGTRTFPPGKKSSKEIESGPAEWSRRSRGFGQGQGGLPKSEAEGSYTGQRRRAMWHEGYLGCSQFPLLFNAPTSGARAECAPQKNGRGDNETGYLSP